MNTLDAEPKQAEDVHGIIFYGHRSSRYKQFEDGALILEKAHLIVNREGVDDVKIESAHGKLWIKVGDVLLVEVAMRDRTRVDVAGLQ